MQYDFRTNVREILADTVTPVSVYLKMRDIFPNALLLESSDHHSLENSYSFICLKAEAYIEVEQFNITKKYPDGTTESGRIDKKGQLADEMEAFFNCFKANNSIPELPANGFFGYVSYDGVQYFETIRFNKPVNPEYAIPEVHYAFYHYIIAINHFQNRIQLIENLFDGEVSSLKVIEDLLSSRNFATFSFETVNGESSNINDDEFKQMVTYGKEHCFRGDVFQIVLSRQYAQQFLGDEFQCLSCPCVLLILLLISSISTMEIIRYSDHRLRRRFRSDSKKFQSIQLPVHFAEPAMMRKTACLLKNYHKILKKIQNM